MTGKRICLVCGLVYLINCFLLSVDKLLRVIDVMIVLYFPIVDWVICSFVSVVIV